MKKNILFIIPSLIGGGAEKTVANLSYYLNAKYNVYICTLLRTEDHYPYSGKLVCITRKYMNHNIFLRQIGLIEQIIKVRSLKKKLKIECSISFLPQADIINVLSSKKEKVIVSIRNKTSAENTFFGRTKKLFIYSIKKADKIISITEGVKYDLADNFGIDSKKIFTIYNPSFANFTTNISQNNIFLKEIDKLDFIITMGRLQEQKGQWHLIRAFTNVLKRKQNVKLIILGQGPLECYLKLLVNNLGIQNSVYFLGFVNNPHEYIKRSRLFVFPSLYEGLGNSILEVMSLGIPIISSDCQFGPREILSPESNFNNIVKDKIDYSSSCGVLIPTCDGYMYGADDPLTKEEILMSNAIIEVLDNEKLRKRIIKNGLKRCKDFNMEHIGKQWIDIIEDKNK